MTEAQAAQRVGAQAGERGNAAPGVTSAEQQPEGGSAASANTASGNAASTNTASGNTASGLALSAEPRAVPTALDVLRGYLSAQSTTFLTQLPRLRDGKPEASHRIRVACRRSRSLLRTYKPLMDGDWADELAARIAEFTEIVSPERDVEVVRARLLAAIDNLADESSGAVRARTLLDRMLHREYAVAHEATLAALAGPRFHALADLLAIAPEAMPSKPEAR